VFPSPTARQRRWHQKRKQKMRQLAVVQNSIASGAGVNRESLAGSEHDGLPVAPAGSLYGRFLHNDFLLLFRHIVHRKTNQLASTHQIRLSS